MNDLARSRQRRYIHELEGGPKTTRDMALSLMVSGYLVARMVKKLREIGVVKSSRVKGVRGNVWSHALANGWQELYAASIKNAPRHRVVRATPAPTPELLHVAQLRVDGWTGQRLVTKHQEQYPSTSEGQVRYLVTTARKRGLCR